jgi:hypothetical protein
VAEISKIEMYYARSVAAMTEYTEDELREIARERMECEQRVGAYPEHRYTPDRYLISVAGEAAFARAFDCEIKRPVDGWWVERGDDFTVAGYMIDVKTFALPYHLLVPVEHIVQHKTDIYVLANWNGGVEAELVGWEYAHVLAAAPHGCGTWSRDNHFIHASKLLDIDELAHVLGGYR